MDLKFFSFSYYSTVELWNVKDKRHVIICTNCPWLLVCILLWFLYKPLFRWIESSETLNKHWLWQIYIYRLLPNTEQFLNMRKKNPSTNNVISGNILLYQSPWNVKQNKVLFSFISVWKFLTGDEIYCLCIFVCKILYLSHFASQ